MQGGWQPPPGGGGQGYGPPGGGYGAPPGGAPPGGGPPGYGAPPGGPPQGFAPNPYGGPPGGPPGMGMMNPQYGNYEFNEYENSIIDKAASRAKLWGIISTVIGALYLLGSCGMVANPGLASYLPSGIVSIVIGITFMGAGNSLKQIVTSQGNDMMHLGQAMQKMSTAFMIQIVCAIIAFALVVLVVLLAMFVFVAAAASQ
ncbi:MAG: DUF5362 family protein [Labilithrix sp.]